jgi:hypothetical protein
MCGQLLITRRTAYGQLLYSALGFDSEKQLLFSSAIYVIGWGFNAFSAFIIDLLPRNKMAAIGLFGCMAALAAEAGIVAEFVHVGANANPALLRAGVAMFYLFTVIYSAFLDGITFVFVGEIYPTHLRAKGINLALGVHSLTNLVLLGVAPTGFAFVLPRCR